MKTNFYVRKRFLVGALLLTSQFSVLTSVAVAQLQTNAGVQYLQAMQKDVSTDFYDLSNTYFLADSLSSLLPTSTILT